MGEVFSKIEDERKNPRGATSFDAIVPRAQMKFAPLRTRN